MSYRTKSPRRTGPSASVVEMVLERASYSCEVCSGMMGDRRGVDWSVHHRRPRQMGGTRWDGVNRPGNLLIVCGHGAGGCHGLIESRRAEAVRNGWLVLSRTDPLTVPVLIERGSRYVYLTDDGEYSDNPPEAV